MREIKDSGVEWIGEIPKDKALLRNKYSLFFEKGRIPESTNNEGLGRPYIGASDLDTNTGYSVYTEDVDIPTARKNDLLVLWDGARAGICGTNLEGAISSTIVKVSGDSTIHKQFLYWYYKGFEWYMLQCVMGTTIPHMSREYIEQIGIINWSSEEQHRIADYLDAKCAQIDRAIARQQEVIEKLKEYKLSVITEAVTKGLNPDVPMKDSGIEWIGEIPEHWETYRIAALYREVYEEGNDELPILSVSINTGVSDRELEDEEQDRIFVRSDDKSKYKRVQIGDLTYNMMRAWQGAFGAVRVEGMVSPAYVVARPHKKEEIDSRYIEYLLRTPAAKEEMRRYSHGIADFRLRLYWAYFKSMKICFPDALEQEAIADYIDNKSAQIDSIIAQKDGLISKLTEYKKSLIYEVVTGKREV